PRVLRGGIVGRGFWGVDGFFRDGAAGQDRGRSPTPSTTSWSPPRFAEGGSNVEDSRNADRPMFEGKRTEVEEGRNANPPPANREGDHEVVEGASAGNYSDKRKARYLASAS